MMEYLFIDFENIAPDALSGISENQSVLLFAGEKQNKISLDLAESLHALGSKAKLIRINGELGRHFESLGEETRPKKAARLKAYIKNFIRKDDSVVEDVIKGLISEKRIGIADGKVSYMGATAENI